MDAPQRGGIGESHPGTPDTAARPGTDARHQPVRSSKGGSKRSNGNTVKIASPPCSAESKIDHAAWKQALRQRMLLEKVIALDVNAKISVTDAEAETYFKANRTRYAAERRVHAAQIVVREREQAEAILKRLKMGEDFDKVAREASIGPEAARGGDLGFFERGVMPEEIDRVVFSLPVGRVSTVVQSPYGFHIFKVLGKDEGGDRTFAQAKELVIADLRKRKETEAFERWTEALRAKAAIVINRPLPDRTSSA